MGPNRQFPAGFVTFTGEILNGKLHFLCSVRSLIQSLNCSYHFVATSVMGGRTWDRNPTNWLISTYRTSPVDSNQTWPYPSSFYTLFGPHSRVYIFFFVEWRFESLSTLSSVASGSLAWLTFLYDHFQIAVLSLVFDKVTLIFHFQCFNVFV